MPSIPSKRQGQLSIFPNYLDEFSIKKPYDPTIEFLSLQPSGSLERADHFNHYFDAIYKIENYFISGSGGLGGPVTTRNSQSASNRYGNDVLLATTTLTGEMSDNVLVIPASVPEIFGSDPFGSLGFSILHTPYLYSRAGQDFIKGIWANNNYGPYGGPSAHMHKWMQIFGMVQPTGGRNFNYIFRNLQVHSTSDGFISSITDNLCGLSTGIGEEFIKRPSWEVGSAGNKGAQLKGSRLAISCERNDGEAYAYIITNKLPLNMTDCYVEFGLWDTFFAGGDPIENRNTGFINESGEVFSRCGPMVRATGSVGNASFYCLSIGDVPWNRLGTSAAQKIAASYHARLLLVQNANLTSSYGTIPTTGTLWGLTTTVTQLVSGIPLEKYSAKRYRLKSEGTNIAVLSSPPPYSSWTVIASANNSTLASGGAGLFAQAMDGANTRGITLTGDLTVASLNTEPFHVKVKLVFLKTGPESELVMQSVT